MENLVGFKAIKVKKRPTIFGVEFAYLYFLAIFMAMIGWIAENTVRLITKGVIDSRFHLLPFISPYGLVVFAVHILLGDPDDIKIFGKRIFHKRTKKSVVASNFLCILIACFFVFIGELAIGNLWGKVFGVQLWDYSSLPLSVTQYAGLIPSLGYGVGAYLLFKFLYTPALKLVRNKVKYKTAVAVNSTLGVLIVLDTIFMMLQIMILGHAPMYWSIRVF